MFNNLSGNFNRRRQYDYKKPQSFSFKEDQDSLDKFLEQINKPITYRNDVISIQSNANSTKSAKLQQEKPYRYFKIQNTGSMSLQQSPNLSINIDKPINNQNSFHSYLIPQSSQNLPNKFNFKLINKLKGENEFKLSFKPEVLLISKLRNAADKEKNKIGTLNIQNHNFRDENPDPERKPYVSTFKSQSISKIHEDLLDSYKKRYKDESLNYIKVFQVNFQWQNKQFNSQQINDKIKQYLNMNLNFSRHYRRKLEQDPNIFYNR